MFVWFRRVPRVALALMVFLGLVMPPAFSQTQAPTVVSVSVTGNTNIASDRILAVVKTKVGDPFNAQTVNDDLKAIFNLGFFSDQAPPVIKQRPDGIAVTFRVIENPIITEIDFDGNAHVPKDTLLALMDSGTGQVLNTQTLQQDLLKINSYYDKIGYGGQVKTHIADVHIDSAKGILALKIVEGLTVRNVIISRPPSGVGDPFLPDALIRKALVTKPGSPYSDDLKDKDFEHLKELYKQDDLQIGDFEAGIDPTSVDETKGTADVIYTIYVARVGAIEIAGNTITHDDVIRRELRLRPGMVITESAVRRDYDRLNNLGFFEKVELDTPPGPDPKRPSYVTLKWNVKEQRTGNAQIGAGYSGGITGTGLTGQISYTQNNINGTGNSGTVKLESGSRLQDASISTVVPYVGKTRKSQKYSFSGTLFTNAQTNFYPVYFVATPAPVANATPNPAATIPVSIIPQNPQSAVAVPGIASTYQARSNGIRLSLGRRLTDVYTVSGTLDLEAVAASAEVPLPFVFPNAAAETGGFAGAVTPTLAGTGAVGNAFGVTAPSLAVIDSTRPFNVRSVILGFGADTRNDVFNPSRGLKFAVSEEVSLTEIGSSFTYTLANIDIAKFFPLPHNLVLGLHGLVGLSTGAIPPNKLFIFSDQQLRGYADPFYGTEQALAQAEIRIPLTPDRKFSIAVFSDDGATKFRGASPQLDPTTGVFENIGDFQWHPDAGVGLRFDVPQLGLRTLRLDFARGQLGTHTAFGIGQSF